MTWAAEWPYLAGPVVAALLAWAICEALEVWDE